MRFLTLLLMMTSVTTSAIATDLLPDVEKDLRAMIANGDVRAVAIGLYADGESKVIGLGQISADDERTPDGDTVFEIGSISKVYTSLLAQVQVDAGNLGWNDTLAARFPGLDFASDQVASITIHELSTHTSGLPRLPDNMKMEDPSDPYEGYSREDLLDFISGYEPDSLDKRYEYSNLGAGLLGVIAADASGASYGDAIQKDVLKPLGLKDTQVGLRPDFEGRLAVGFSGGADMANWDGFDSLAGAGALVSTVNDVLKFATASLEGKSLDGAIASIQKRQGKGATGFGWHIEETDDGSQIIWHNGGTGGYASFLAIDPAKQSATVLLTTSTEYARITDLGFEQAAGKPREKGPDNLDDYEGAYKLAEGFTLSIFVRDGSLFGQATGQGAFALKPQGTDTFAYSPADIVVTFERDADGVVNKLNLKQAGTNTPAERVGEAEVAKTYEAIDIDPSILGDYAGRYQLVPNIVITVEPRGDQLFVALTGQPAYPVFPYETDRFFYKVVDAQLEFERDESGKVVAVTLHQMGEQRAPRIDD